MGRGLHGDLHGVIAGAGVGGLARLHFYNSECLLSSVSVVPRCSLLFLHSQAHLIKAFLADLQTQEEV